MSIADQKQPTFRKITAADVDPLFAIRTSVRENPMSLAALAAPGITVESVTQSPSISHDGYLCECSGRVAGFAMADLQTGELWVIAVHPGFERLGATASLLRIILSSGSTSTFIPNHFNRTAFFASLLKAPSLPHDRENLPTYRHEVRQPSWPGFRRPGDGRQPAPSHIVFPANRSRYPCPES